MANLTQAWTRAAAALPLGWQLMGVVLGPRQADPVIRSANWVAWARGPDGERSEGMGENPPAALLELSYRLSALRGDTHGAGNAR